MIKVENVEVFNFEGAVRGMRLPMNSGAKSDSKWVEDPLSNLPIYQIGKNDLDLMKKLFKASLEQNYAHRKYLRQVFVSMDITAPETWWMQFDTYKINVTCNSESKMHTIHKRDLTLDDFSYDNMSREGVAHLKDYIEIINMARRAYVRHNNPTYWNDIIGLLPMSFNQKRTVTMNYENVVNMIHQRSDHKLSEWREFTNILKDLPYVKEIMED